MRFPMLLQGPGVDDAGRRWVTEQLDAGHLAVAPPGVFVANGVGVKLAHLGYREPPERWLETLGALVGGGSRRWTGARPELTSLEYALRQGRTHGVEDRLTRWLTEHPEDDSGAAWAKLLLGVSAYRLGDQAKAHAWWARVIEEHVDHPLSHRARYHLYDAETWPTRLHEDLAGAELLPPARPAASVATPAPLDMVPIPAGTFVMGGSPALLTRELPTHTVTLTRPFSMSATPVTQGQWAAFSGHPPPDGPEWPQTGVCFADALRFCGWLSERESRTYRLPTEAEWEWAARGGLAGAQYPWGDEPITPERCNYLGPRPVPVRSFAPNGYGLYEMVGNVQEWTSDFFRERAYAERAGSRVVDPRGPVSADQDLPLRVVRGGQCGASVIQLFCRNSFRLGVFEEYAGGSIGLRVVREEP